MAKPSLPAPLRNAVAALHDGLMAALSLPLALYLRLGDERVDEVSDILLPYALAFAALALAVFIATRLYRGLWRYASLPDILAIARSATLAVALFYLMLFALTRLEGIPRSAPFIQWMLLVAMLTGPRVLYRAAKDGTLRFDFRHDASRQIPLLVIGATGSAELFIRETARDPHSLYRVVGLIDNNAERRGRSMHNIRIYGGTDSIPAIVHKLARKGLKPQRLIIADETIEGKTVEDLLAMAERLGLTLGRLSSLSAFRDGAHGRPELRPVAIEDLLGRAQAVHDQSGMKTLISGKRVVITGAGGSIGAELTRQIAALAPASLTLIDLSEHFLYEIDHELGEKFARVPRRAVIADVRDSAHIMQLFTETRPELVFHAAAIKHVPLSESNPLAAISTNVLGSRNVAEAAARVGAQAMVSVSTDKAVHPTNVMGATKRLAEAFAQALGQAKTPTRFFTVRFGNVLGSHGSVVPLFERQIREGGPVTVTHPDMVRYFMTIREAVELVLQAAALGQETGKHEAIFVLDMQKPIRITELATKMIRLTGLIPGKDIDIAYTGLRPGEKLFEELFYDEEKVSRTAREGVLIATPREVALEPLKKSLATLEDHCRQGNLNAALALLASLVPEYKAP